MKSVLSIIIACFFHFADAAFGAGCQVTLSADSPVAAIGALPVSADSSHGWYGSEALAALIPKDGMWKGMGPERNYFDKFWWWRRGFDAKLEPTPNLVISARRLDGPTDSFEIANATSGFSSNPDQDWNSMLVGMEFPSGGCWEITGTYSAEETLKVVLQVGSISKA